MDGSRIVFRETDTIKGVSIGVSSSTGSPPYLVKAIVSRDTEGQQVQTPFIATPSLFRLESDSTSQIRIMKSPGVLPRDRESLFYLRTVAMPAGDTLHRSDAPAVAGSLQVATGQVIKLFWRPEGLSIPQPRAMKMLQFSITAQGLKATNPTPYYITLSQLNVNGKPIKLNVTQGGNMLAPHGSVVWSGSTQKGPVAWTAVNDYGGTETFHGTVN